TILPPQTFEVAEELKGRKRREEAGKKLYDLMSETQFATSPYRRTVYRSILDAMHIHGGSHIACEDINRAPLSFRMLVARSIILGKKLRKDTRHGDPVGLLLPSANATLVAFLGLHAFGRVPAMLNFSAGAANITSACNTAKLKHVFTSRKFIEAGKLDSLVPAIQLSGAKLHYLEDIAPTVSKFDKIYGLLAAYTSCLWQHILPGRPDDSAVILFTSGSEGAPKGVVLSHTNLMANRHQVAARIAFGAQDIVFNAMPLFHSFGLTGATLLPITAGARVFFYPSPLHYRIVPELTYDTNATILFGTDTFLAGYAKFANPYDFYRVRLAVSGAEKLKDETRRVYSEKYGVRILEGYGATETAPVISVNTPMQNKAGTVGRILPGMEYRLEPMPGIDEGGKLIVRGPNVMRGYLLADKPGQLQPPADGWYDTGDIVKIDSDGFVHILGRAKRFAKIGGEMVSLAAVESYLSKLWPETPHAVVAIPDDKKGEQLVLFTEKKGAERAAILEYARANGIQELSIPKTVKVIEKMPLLGTGKVDYPAVQKLVSQKQDASA
ncbi:MAG: AMP-binding protein, partial [Alphaproteobacteria bacterium]|nr:AMP-binding protein [Alphaproteobacteria bacterium]